MHTLRRRSSKNALQVAPLAHDLRVAAAEREAGAAVIDFDICADTPLGKSGIRHQHRAAYGQESSNNCPGKEPTSYPASQLRHFYICHRSTTVACAHNIAPRFHCTEDSILRLGYNSQRLDRLPSRKNRGNTIPSRDKARDVPFAMKTSQACDSYTKLRFCMGESTQ